MDFRNSLSQPPKKHFQFGNIMASKPNIDDQGGQLPPNYVRSLAVCNIIWYQSIPVNHSHIAQTTHSL